MNLLEAIKKLTPTTTQPEVVPSFLYGAFRRKSISFFNGLTDQNTIVYWFQSRSFTIDLRLKSQNDTPVTERQGWIGNTYGMMQRSSCPGKLNTTPIIRTMCSGLNPQNCMRSGTVFWNFHRAMSMSKTGVSK
jgi:hypothetical protein